MQAALLSASNFLFDEVAVVTNTGEITIDDGAVLPLAGLVHNSGSITLDATDAESLLQIIQHGMTLDGGGTVTLSDSAHNVITGTSSSVEFINVDNVISGAGQIGAGQMELSNSGTILATG